MSEELVYCCHVCGAPGDCEIVGIEVDGIYVDLPHHFVYLYRGDGKPLGLCNQCFEARRFDGFAPYEVAYFYEEFNKPD